MKLTIIHGQFTNVKIKKLRSLKQPNSCNFWGLNTQKRYFDLQAPENSKKVPFQGPEKPKYCHFRGLKTPIWSREPL
jgi:hypothetical protein